MTIPDNQKDALIRLARQAVESQVLGSAPPAPPQPLQGVFAEQRGCFVTLTNGARLRGCIGTFHPRGPLGETIVEMGRAAARDPRFVYDPIEPAELDQLRVEISVLSELERTTEPEKLTIGEHGIYVVCGGQAGCFLPEVATDQGWDAREFLSQCCAGKGGLPSDAWKDPSTEVYLFTSEKFGG
jgi:AmmeMemoRadiSam system protein A